MPLTVLGDRDVSAILHSLTKNDILDLQQSLADALHWYSTSNNANDYCSDFQPERTVLKRKDGSTTLFMPASGMNAQGIKVITVQDPEKGNLPSVENLALKPADSFGKGSDSPRGSVSTFSSTSTAPSVASPSIAAPSTGDNVDTGQTSISSDISASQSSTIRGSLTLLDGLGNTTGLLNAKEVTAFRTALASTMLLKKRHNVHTVTIFGAGKQAYWHARLALLLRGPEIHHLNFVTRNFDTARKCLIRIYNPLPDDPDYVNPIGSMYNSKTRTAVLTPMHTEYERLLKEYVRSSEVIFCTTPSTKPLFPGSYLTNPEGRKKGRYIACIGSYKPHMLELHPDVLRQAVAPHHEHRHFHKHQKEGGAVIVDTVSGCMEEAGEIVQAKLLPDQIVELGELFMLKREAERKRAEARVQNVHEEGEHGGELGGCQIKESSGLMEWLTKGNVIYKSVGLGLMDVVVGDELVRLANERGIGTMIPDF